MQMLFKQLKTKAQLLKREIVVLYLALKDRRTPLLAKLLAAVTAGYMLSPIDLIPDFIPVFGMLDDLIIIPILIKLTIKLIPNSLLEELRANVVADTRLSKNWWYALPVIVIYVLLFIWLFRIYLKPLL
mgnify:CR=1 FL=1